MRARSAAPTPAATLSTVLLLAMVAALLGLAAPHAAAQQSPDTYDGSDLWLRYVPVDDPGLLAQYRDVARAIIVENAEANPVHRHTPDLAMEPGSSEHLVDTTLEAARDELVRGLGGLLDRDVPIVSGRGRIPDGAVIVGTRESSVRVRQHIRPWELREVGDEGYVIRSVSRGRDRYTVIAGNTEIGALYGTFDLLRRIQTQEPIGDLDVVESPRIANRHLNNWETVRLYAGNSPDGTGGLDGEDGTIFNFDATGESADRNLPVILDRYMVVARAAASIGINGFEINLVNADNVYLTDEYIEMEAALADALRPYGVKISLAINYTAPTDPRFDETLSEDQLDPYSDEFRGWWTDKASEIQAAIPDFMGFTVKANSEGQPGPQDFGYDHGDGANGIAAAVAPLGMDVYWRTFVYNADVDPDRLKRAYLEFGPIDDEPQPDGTTGRFLDNVFLQTKNGPLDFQAREPINPMFGRLENTNQALELQITQEYTGQSTMLAYLGPMWEEVLKTDTYATDADGDLLEHRLVGHVVDGTAQGHTDTAIVGVANLGNADNLTGHHFSQANLFAFGRQAWDWTLDAEDIAEDWVRMTWSDDEDVVDTIVRMMMGSWEALVSYQTPFGIAHQFRASDHYGPAPDQFFIRPDWSPVYYNQADEEGLGYDRSPTGSDFVSQYFPVLEERYGDIDTVPENLLMWFHHVPWDREMDSGRIFWEDLVYRYQMGVQYVTWMREAWASLEDDIDQRRWEEVAADLAQHEIDAADWRDTNVEYWQEFSGLPMPTDDAPLSIAITVDGTVHDGFDLSQDSYTIEVPEGASPTITEVDTADPDATYEIVSQADAVGGQAVVEVTTESFFGPLLKRYVFEMVEPGGDDTAVVEVSGLSVPATVLGGEANDVTVSVRNTDSTDAVEVTAEVEGPDGWDSGSATQTIAAGAAAQITVPVTPALEPVAGRVQPATLTARVTAADVEVEGAPTAQTVAVPSGDLAVLALDAGTESSAVQPGYQRLAPSTAWDPAAGYGWVDTEADSRDRGGDSLLQGDFTWSGTDADPGTLRIDVPAGTHRVYALTGDACCQSSDTFVTVDGERVAETGELLPGGQFSWLSFELDGGDEGRTVDLVLEGEDYEEYWRLNALVVLPD